MICRKFIFPDFIAGLDSVTSSRFTGEKSALSRGYVLPDFIICLWSTTSLRFVGGLHSYGVYAGEYLWHKKRQASKPAVFGMGSLDDASAVAVFELLAAAAGAWVVASGHLVFDDGRVSPCFGSLACVLSCGGGLCGVAEIVFTFGVSL